MRVFLFVEYDGSKFGGFQEQPNKNSVMNQIIFACEKLKITSKPIGSSRTDKGVHALNQVVHLDIPPFWENISNLKNALNRLLLPYIHIRKIIPVKQDAHARFDAIKRLYRYVCYTGKYNPFLSDYALFSPNLNLQLANKSLSLFLGSHDFGFFKKTGSETKNDIRTLYKADAYRYKNFIVFRFLGDGFLRSQVRMMMAAVISIQTRDLSLEDLKAQIDKQKRSSTKAVAPCGLYLSRVYYNQDL